MRKNTWSTLVKSIKKTTVFQKKSSWVTQVKKYKEKRTFLLALISQNRSAFQYFNKKIADVLRTRLKRQSRCQFT